MTIASAARKAGPLLGTGAQTAFPFTFKVFADGDLLVTRADALGAETALVLDVHYTVTLNPNQDTSPGGVVNLITAPAVGEKITIIGDVDYDQPLDLPSGGNFSPLALENQLDRMTMQIQQLREIVGRTLRAPVSSTASTLLPAPSRNALIGWDQSETTLQNFPLSEIATALAFATYRYDTFTGNGVQVLFPLTSDPVTLGNMDVSLDGLTAVPGVDYALSTGSLVFATPPAAGVQILARYGQGITGGPAGDAADIAAADGAGGALWTTVAGFITRIRSALGASVVGFVQAGVGAVAGSVQQELRQRVSVTQFGAAGDGIADDTAAFAAAFASLGPKGGTVHYYDKHLIDSNLTIPANVTLKGPMTFAGTPGTNAGANYDDLASLRLNSAATITLMQGAGVDGCLIFRKGMIFPVTDVSTFAGIAITSGGDDNFVTGSMVLGFNKAFYSLNQQRARIRDFYFDCTNGIEIAIAYDVPRISQVHGWPFATIRDGVTSAQLRRSGIAFYMRDVGDWNKLTDCFCYGYHTGFRINNANSISLLSCSADSTGEFAGQTGFLVEGTSTDTRLVSCQAAAQESGFFINTTAGVHTSLTACDAWDCTNNCIVVNSGDAHIIGGTFRGTPIGLSVSGATSRVFNDLSRYASNSSKPISVNVSNPNVIIGKSNDYGVANGTTYTTGGLLTTIPSADPLLLPPNQEIVFVSGITNFGGIAGGSLGKRITLLFTGNPIVLHGGAAPNGILLTGAANFSASVNSSLSLVYNGSQWVETGRKV